MTAHPQLKSANELAKNNGVRFPNESSEYRHARDALLAEEIELRRHIERVAEQRRALPASGIVPKNYALIGENGPANFSELFGDKQTLAVYSYRYGPKRAQPCPMCSSLMAAWDGEALDVNQRIALVMVARSPIERLLGSKRSAVGAISGCTRTSTATSPATMSARKTPTCRPSMFSPVAMAAFAISGAVRWAEAPLIQDKTRAVRLT